MSINFFVLIAGLLYLGACIQYAYQREWKLCIVMIAYAIANFALCLMKEK